MDALSVAGPDLAVLIAYLVMLLGIGMAVSYRRRHEDDLFLGGRSFGWANVGLSIFGTNIGPSFLLASASAAFASGMVTANFEWLAWIYLMLLGMVFAPFYLHTGVSTMPGFIRLRFGPAAYSFLTGYALLAIVVLWLGGSLYAGGVLLGQITGWPLWVSVVVLMVVATSFTVAGGLAAVIVTDTFQSILMIVGASTLAILGVHKAGGIDQIIQAVPDGYWTLTRPASDPHYPWYAIYLGYPVLGIWFWCTDQTIVQRVLGARDIRQGQRGTVFAGFLKILPPFLFMVPGICCRVLFPDLENPDDAFMTMAAHVLPAGMVGLIVAVLIAALISTVDSGLNSFSTIFTLDVVGAFRPGITPRQQKKIGRLVTVLTAFLAVGCAVSMQHAGKNMFDLLQSIIAYFAPPVAAVFLVGVLWRGATSTAALVTLYLGTTVSLTIGTMNFFKFPSEGVWPHFLLMAFLLFVGLVGLMVVLSVVTRNDPREADFPRLADIKPAEGSGSTWGLWGVLAVIMIALYAFFN